jgi:hypothetical protein
MKASRTVVTLMVAAGLVMALAIPASARKPVPETVKVTMTLAPNSDEGLTRDCNDVDGANGYFLMTRDRGGLVDGEFGAVLGLYMDEVAWDRQNPSSSGSGFGECHGATVDGSPVENVTYGMLGISIDPDGAVTDVLWHFDYYLDETTIVNPKNGKERQVSEVREYFTLSGSDLDWDADTSTVSGPFRISHSLRDTETGEEFYYQAFPGSPRWLEFTLTIEPNN